MQHTLRSSLLPNGALPLAPFDSLGLEEGVLSEESCFGGLGLGSCLGGLGLDTCFGGSGFFSGGGGGDFVVSSDLDWSFAGSGSDEVACDSDAGSLGSELAFSFSPPWDAPPVSIFTKSCPTVTVSSSFTRNSLIVPASGALTATSIYITQSC